MDVENKKIADYDLSTITEMLVPFYKEASLSDKQKMWFCLSMWLAEAKVSPISTAIILRVLYEYTKDKDPIIKLVAPFIYGYKKAGVDIEPYKKGIEEKIELGDLNFSSLPDSSSPDFIIDSLYELLLTKMSVGRALFIIKRIEEILGVVSPFLKDPIFGVMRFNPDRYVIAEPINLKVIRASEFKGEIIIGDIISDGIPTELVVYEYLSPDKKFLVNTKFQMEWKTNMSSLPIFIPESSFDEVLTKLKSMRLIRNKNVSDALSALINAYMEKGKATIIEKVEGVIDERGTEGSNVGNK